MITPHTPLIGRHWETGSVANHLAAQGITAPHTGEPYSEALLMGVSGGAVFGYFTFFYEGYDPIVALLTRNTFDPLDAMLSRLGVEQTRKQTTSADKGLLNLKNALADGYAPIVWADSFTLPYNDLPFDAGMWGMLPIVVFGLDEASETATVGDCAKVPHVISAESLAAARARIKKDKFRVLTLSAPNPDKLPSAVRDGIEFCIQLYTEKPPKGSKNNFGLLGLKQWAKMLSNHKQRQSWHKTLPAGPKLYAGLKGTYERITTFGQVGGNAERHLYAAFLDEAAVILGNGALPEVAGLFRECGDLWVDFGRKLLPDTIPPLAETRQLLLQKQTLFIEQGAAALSDIKQINARLGEIKVAAQDGFSLTQSDADRLCEMLAERLHAIHDKEREAVEALRLAML